MSGVVKMRDVAERAGVSLPTVSHVLSNKREGVFVSEATRERVAEIAREMGYKRNNSAVAMKSGRFGSVALLLSTRDDVSSLPARVLSGIHSALADLGLHLSVAALPDEALTDAGVVPQILREWACDGLLINYTDHIPARMIELIRAHQMPAVWINSQQETDCVFPDDRAAGFEVTRKLIEMGHRRIAWADSIHAPDDAEAHYSAQARAQGFRDAMHASRLEPREMWHAQATRGAMREMLALRERPTALVSYSSTDVATALVAAASVGLEVPRDLSLATFGPLGEKLVGDLCAGGVVPEARVGGLAVEMLAEKIARPEAPLPPRAVPFEICDGATWGQAPNAAI